MNETQHKALMLLGLARKARKLEIGEEPCGIACRSGKAKLLLIARIVFASLPSPIVWCTSWQISSNVYEPRRGSISVFT